MTDAKRRKRAQGFLIKHLQKKDFDATKMMLAFAAEERKAERERCARVCRDLGYLGKNVMVVRERCAAAIEKLPEG